LTSYLADVCLVGWLDLLFVCLFVDLVMSK